MPVIFRVKLGKTGNSLKITVPRPIVEGFGWNEGDEIVLITSEEEIVLRRSPKSERQPVTADKDDLSEND
jgi:AbrB family looped-hinge helix DNA binding protein